MDNLEEMEKFSNVIIDRVNRGKIDYLDAIISYCDELSIDQELILDLISPFIISKLEEEAIKNKLLKSTTRRLQFS